MKSFIIQKAKEFRDYVIEMRRRFHMYPELKFEERETSKVVEAELIRFGYDIRRLAGTGIVGDLQGKDKEGRVVALRADMDALPIQEENDVPYKSNVPGKMHACGHDAHTAMLLGAAKILAEVKDLLNGSVRLIFQPAEEGGCGAKKMIEEGCLKEVNAIFGIHVWADLPSGVVATRGGPMMASSDGFLVEVEGKGGHAALPHLTKDPTVPAVDIYNAFQKLISRAKDPFSPAVIATPVLEGSVAYNTTPSNFIIRGTLRTFDKRLRDVLLNEMREITECYSKAWGCKGRFSLFREPYFPTVNDSEMVEFAMNVAKNVGQVQEAEMVLVSEDFSYYLQHVRGAFMFLGVRNESKGIVYPHHHPKFDVDENVLWKGTALYALLGYEYLRSFS